jgi:hypothetical protein
MPLFEPPFTPSASVDQELKSNGFALINPADFSKLTKHSLNDWNSVQDHWNHLPPDNHLKDGGHYRKRRHASVIIDKNDIKLSPHRPHWQPVSYNALHGGIDRWFEPCEEEFLEQASVKELLLQLAKTFWSNKGLEPNHHPWFVEVHQFRIDTTDGIGRPTPEGAHRDGVDFVAVLLIDKQKIKGGESRIFLNDSPKGQRFTLNQPWSLLLLDDHKIIHETTPIQPIDPNKLNESWRDTLVLTYRQDSFQDKTN